MLRILGAFVAGLFLFNAVPHLVRGITGRKHMTPFGRESSALVNVLWAWVNLIIGGLLAAAACPGDRPSLVWYAAFGLGGLLISIYLAVFWSNPEARLPWHKD